ncbi:MAG: protein meaA [Gammaproteobacteria bacterium]|nr:protein meaA [Gammaproteobacteria bacterium]MCP5424864.1 protein meaA [Gammaproteobacteria bacterium]MCP5458159.1 protein meaA [Gammaproteobacteria bacterium]
MEKQPTKRDKPWLMRTYSGHSSAKASNQLYRTNLAKGQTGLSVAFDLPTQTGYDSDHVLARGEVGKVGVPIGHIGDMETLFDQIPLAQMNTSMTINATAAWLLSLYVAVAERQGASQDQLQGTTQNDIIKEYLSRGTYIYPPEPSVRLITDVVCYTVKHIPKWNPTNICSYHLQEAGATPVQELAYALSTGITILDAVRDSGQVSVADFADVVGRISFFVNAGIRFVEECCKMRAFARMWDKITQERYGVEDEKMRRFRYGVQVNSLGLTESQPENNVQRIILEMLAVTLSKNARARAIQLPAWNEALGLPRPWDQQWALRMQQVLAFETDLLEYGDILAGSTVIEAKVQALIQGAEAEMERVREQGGMIPAIETGYVKRQLVTSHTERMRAIERGDLKIIGLNCFQQTEPSPLVGEGEGSIMKVDPRAEREQIERLQAFRTGRNQADVDAALAALADAAKSGDNIMPVSIRCAHAGVTTGEWGQALREAFGEYRPPTGIDISLHDSPSAAVQEVRDRVRHTGEELGRPLRILVGKPGLDGHSNGAEQIAVKARDVGFEIVYQGIRLTPQQIAKAALEEGVHLIGLSVLSGSHMELVEDITAELAKLGIPEIPVIVGGIIPVDDEKVLRNQGIAAVYTPKNIDMNAIMADMVDIIRASNGLKPYQQKAA